VCIYYIMCNMTYVECRYSMLNGLIDSRKVRRAKAVGSSQSSGAASRQSCTAWCLLSKMVHLTARANVLPLRQHHSTADVGKFEWLSIFMHWNIGQYRVLMNSISCMLPKCWVERSSSGHINASSTSVWANGSLDLYPASRRSSTRTCYILYVILNQYYQKPSLIPWSIK
jgi:hypothetical protein